MTATAWDFDGELWRWTWRAPVEAGVAGTASTELTPNVHLVVDAWSGNLLQVSVDVDDDHGRLSDGDAEVVDRTLGARIDGAAPASDPVAGAVLGRLARVEESARVARALGDASPAWAEELAILRAELGLDDDPAGPGAPAGGPDAVAPVRPDLALERLASRRHDLGVVPAAAGRVAIDPSFVPTGILDLAEGAWIEWDGDRGLVRVELDVRPDLYAPAVDHLMCVVLAGATIVAAEPLRAGLGSSGRVAGIAELVVARTRSLDDLAVLVTDAPRSLPSPELRTRRAAVSLARAAATAFRLGGTDLSTALLDLSVRRWTSIGVPPTPGQAPDEPPFRGELAL